MYRSGAGSEHHQSLIDYFHKTVKEDAADADLKKLAEQGLAAGPWLDDYGWWGNAFLTAWENAAALRLFLVMM